MRIGVTYDEVAAIADQIVAGGAEPTIRNVRDRLGRGSYSTIHRHLTAWRDARPPASSDALTEQSVGKRSATSSTPVQTIRAL